MGVFYFISSTLDSKDGSPRAKARERAESGSRTLNISGIPGLKYLVIRDRVLLGGHAQNKIRYTYGVFCFNKQTALLVELVRDGAMFCCLFFLRQQNREPRPKALSRFQAKRKNLFSDLW